MAYVPDSLFRSNHEETHFQTSSQDFHGVSEFLMRRSMSFSGMDRAAAEDQLQPEDEVSDDGSAQMLGEKKRRLNLEQVRALEKSFELGNKLEPERKIQLARALALQPRQVAIWFQNRRARWKTKQLEKDYDVLKRQYEAIKADNESLKSQNKRLQSQLMAMKTRDSKGSGRINLNKENEGSWSNGSDDNSCEVNLNNTTSTDSTLYPHRNQDGNNGSNGAVLFPNPATDLIQLLQGSSNSRADENIPLQLCHKIQNSTPPANEGFCNMFTAIEENPDFWPWSEHQNFH